MKNKKHTTFKNSIENHPFIYLIGCVVAATSISISILMYYTNQKIGIYEAEKSLEIKKITQDFEQKLYSSNLRVASIERRMGESKDFFDVARIMVVREKVSATLPDSNFYTEDRFYASIPEPSSGWLYEKTTEIKLMSEISGSDQNTFSQKAMELGSLIPIHMWRKNHIYKIVDIKGSVSMIFSFIYVQRLPHKIYPKIIGVSIADRPKTDREDIEVLEKKDEDREISKDEVITALDGLYRGDAAGLYLTMLLQTHAAIALGAGFHYEITSLQKKGNVVYCRAEYTIYNAVVNGKKHEEFYMVIELMLISTPEELFFVKTLVPTPDRRSEDFRWVTTWFGTFGIPVQ